MPLVRLLTQIAREIGVPELTGPPCVEPAGWLPGLRELYALADGFELPFLRVYPAVAIRRDVAEGWDCFGEVAGGACCLHGAAGFDLWEPDGDCLPAPHFHTAGELLRACYREQVEQSDLAGVVVVGPASAGAPRHMMLRELRAIWQAASAELLRALHQGRVEVQCTRRAGLAVVRGLRALGVDSHLRLVE